MNICIVEDHLLIVRLLQSFLSADNEVHDIKTYLSAEAFLADDFSQWKPDIILLDLVLPGMNGLVTIDKAKEKPIEGKFIMLTSTTDIGTIKKAMAKGIDGYLSKEASEEELIEAIHRVHKGGKYINNTLKDKIIEQQFNLNNDEPDFNLSPRESKVLLKICAGNTQKEIAYEMGLSVNTIRNYISNIMGKLKVNRTTDIVLFAIKNGLYTPPTNK